MVFENYMFAQVLFLLGVLFFLCREVFLVSKRSDEIERKQLYLLQIILLVGVLVRMLFLFYPNGINVDGAMGGYDAWCLATFGVDSNLAQYPIYLRSWGEGQSVLYAYLAIPFIKLYGLSPEIYRLPMSFIGCFSLLFFYFTLRKIQSNTLLVFCLSAFLAVNPWHILKSRIGLDCNIFPDILLVGMCFILLAYYSYNSKKQMCCYVTGFSLISLSAYGYAVSWFMLPLLYLCLFYYLIRYKKISRKNYITSLIFSFLIALPLLLFSYLLLTNGEQFQIGPITITTLLNTRLDYVSSSSYSIFYNVKEWIKVLIMGVDIYPMVTMYFYGYFYNFLSLPFLFVGLYFLKKEKFFLNRVFGFWLICSLPILFIVSPGIYHWNTLWFPFIFFAGYGIYKFAQMGKPVRLLIFSLYLFSFLGCGYIYLDSRSYNPFEDHTYREELKFAQSLEGIDVVYYPDYIIHSFILFYSPVSPLEYATTKEYTEGTYRRVKSYSNVKIEMPDNILPLPKTAYVMPNAQLNNVDVSAFKIKPGLYYSVIWND